MIFRFDCDTSNKDHDELQVVLVLWDVVGVDRKNMRLWDTRGWKVGAEGVAG